MSLIVRLLCCCVVITTTAFNSVSFGQQDAAAGSDDLFFFRPDTTAKRISGALLAERLDRPSLAQNYLAEIIASQPDNETLLELRSDFGIGTFLKLSSIESLHPESRDLLKLINEASRQEAPSAQTVELLIPQLEGSLREVTQTATRILAAEENAVVPLLNADTGTLAGRRAAKLLKDHARRFRRGLLQTLPQSDPQVAVRILQLLSTTGAVELTPSLLPYVYADDASVSAAAAAAIRKLTPEAVIPDDAAAAAEYLAERALSFVQTAGLAFPTAADRAMEHTLAQQLYRGNRPDIFGTVLLKRAVELARDAARISDAEQVIAALLLCEATQQAWPLRWPQKAVVPVNDAAVPPNAVDVAAFKLALKSENPASVLQFLSRPSVVHLLSTDRQVLRACEDFPDPRVRLLTAAVAVTAGVERKPLLAMLEKTRAAAVRPQAVAIDSRQGQSRESSSVLQAMQFAAAATSTGVSGFRTAAAQLHCDLLLVHTNCVQWSLSQTVANLRADARTKTTPIVIYGPAQFEHATEVLRERYPGVWFAVQPVSELTLPDTLALLNVPPPRLTVAEREAMVRFARTVRDALVQSSVETSLDAN